MRETAGSFWSNCGPMDQSRYNYNNQSGNNDYGNGQNYNSFPPPSSYGNSGFNSNQRDMYGGNNQMSGNGMGSRGSSVMNRMAPSGNMGSRMGGMDNNSNYNNSNNDPNILSSIQSLSQQMSSQQNDIASKILNAVLSTTNNLMGNMQNQPRSYDDREMRRDYDRRPSRRRSRSPPSYRRRSRDMSSDRGVSSRVGPSRFDTRGRFSSRGSSRFKYESLRYRAEARSRSDRNKRSRGGRSTSKDRGANGKRRKTDKESDGKDDDESKLESDSEEGGKEKKPKLNDDIPLEALYCHMCKHGNFTSVHTYLCHLEGIRHLKTGRAFHEKNEATLEYLRQNAKLASIRFGGYDRSVSTRCSVCLCIVRESFVKHKKLLEHKLVSRFLKPKCCGRFFRTRFLADEHKLSLPHLRKVYEENKEKHLLLEDKPKGEMTKWNFEEAIKHLKGMNPQIAEELTLDNIPPFDGNTPIGVNFLGERDALLCKPCEQLIPIGVKSLDNHMLSADHYNMVVDYLRKRRRDFAFDMKSKKGEGEDEDLTEVGEDIVGPKRRHRGDDDGDVSTDEEDDAVPEEVVHLSDDEEVQQDESNIVEEEPLDHQEEEIGEGDEDLHQFEGEETFELSHEVEQREPDEEYGILECVGDEEENE